MREGVGRGLKKCQLSHQGGGQTDRSNRAEWDINYTSLDFPQKIGGKNVALIRPYECSCAILQFRGQKSKTEKNFTHIIFFLQSNMKFYGFLNPDCCQIHSIPSFGCCQIRLQNSEDGVPCVNNLSRRMGHFGTHFYQGKLMLEINYLHTLFNLSKYPYKYLMFAYVFRKLSFILECMHFD